MKLPRWLGPWARHNESALPVPADTPIDEVRYVVFDTELTSLDKRSNRLLSIGAIAMEGAKIRLQDQFYQVVNPGVAVPAQGILIHGLRPADVESGAPPLQVLDGLKTFVEGAVLVGHFVEIDTAIVHKELGVGGALGNPAICTARVERWMLRRGPYSEDLEQKMQDVDLASLAKIYGLDFKDAHHALQDAFLTARLWQRQIYSLRALKIETLGQLLRFARV